VKQSKKEKKVGKVMREFKSGTLKSGGSGKKVTNPKQAIAIALSEANAMNQGGMMQNPVMQRPMFQTPMQRQGLGIMAGVAPVRGYEEGGEVEDELTFMDYARVAPEILGEMIVGEDDTMDDFFSLEKTEEGSGLNLRDITDFFIVDPDDPEDVAIATATAGLMATGVGAPGAIAAKLGRMGFKGKKVANAVEKAIRLGVGDTKGKTFGRGQMARILLPEDAVAEEEVSEEGIASLPQVQEAKESPKEGIASLPQKSGRFGEGEQKTRNNLANVSREQLDAYGGSLTQYMNEWNKTGKRPTSIKEMAEGDMVSALTAEELDDIGLTAEEFEALDKPVREQYLDLINDRRLAAQVAYNLGVLPGGAVDIATAIPRGIGQLADEFAGSRVGRVLGLSEPGEEVEEFDVFPLAGSALEGIEENMPVTESDIISALKEKPEPPTAPDSAVDEEAMDNIDVASTSDEEPGKFRKFLGNLQDTLTDPRTRYAIAKANQPSEGFTPRNALSDMIIGAQEYDQLQAQSDKETALEKNLVTLKELMPEKSTDELLKILLDQGSDEEKLMVSTLLSLFDTVSKTPQGMEAGPQGTLEIVRNLMGGTTGKSPITLDASGERIDSQTGEEIET
tara:strand:- start:9469 stop:11331 length:1863 start_codon:yes stop_codon:yes gene_type:complete